jgi:hypothetical protein
MGVAPHCVNYTLGFNCPKWNSIRQTLPAHIAPSESPLSTRSRRLVSSEPIVEIDRGRRSTCGNEVRVTLRANWTDTPKMRQGSRLPAARRCGKPPALRTIPPLIRCSSPPRPSSSTSASAGSHYRHCRCSPVGSARQARAGPRQPPRARPPWRRRPPECAITSGRRSLSPPQVDA